MDYSNISEPLFQQPEIACDNPVSGTRPDGVLAVEHVITEAAGQLVAVRAPAVFGRSAWSQLPHGWS